jgi:outer membrane biosynthesis protein TonB
MRRRATVEAAASLLFCSAVLASHVEQFHVSQVLLTQAQSKAETFSGKIVSQNGVRFVLRDDDNNVWYHLDDQEKASKLFGKDVLVTGTFDGLTGTIRVQSIVEGTPREKPPAKPEEMKQNREPAKDQAAPLAGTDTVAPSSQQTSPAQEPVGKVPTPSLDSRISSESEGLNHSQNEMSVNPVRGVPPAAMLVLPEEPVSASSSVAISARRSVPVPPGFSPETLPTKNLLVGRLLKRVDPSYPLDAIQQRIEGTVRLHVVIGEDGKLQSLEPMSGPPLLVGATVIAVSQWRYAPTLFNGHRIQIQEDIKLEFRLPD